MHDVKKWIMSHTEKALACNVSCAHVHLIAIYCEISILLTSIIRMYVVNRHPALKETKSATMNIFRIFLFSF